MRKIIINTVNLCMGGALQRSISFLNELKLFGVDEYHIFYSYSLREQISIESFPENFYFYFFDKSPAALLSRIRIVRGLNKLENKIKPDVVFSFVGPAYWKPKAKHLVGFGLPHIVYDEYEYVKNYSFKVKLEMLYKKMWTKYEADHYVVQTSDVKYRLSDRLLVAETNIHVVTNGYGKQYKDIHLPESSNGNVKRLLLISRYRPSKNFEIINEVVEILKATGEKYEFHITIENDIYNKIFSENRDWVINHGPTFAKDCPYLYHQCDAMFLPSFLECFSASYPEAMKMNKPILTSNLSFARTVCNDAALYFDNTNPEDIISKIKLLFGDDSIYHDLIVKGNKQLQYFDTSEQQAKKYIELCKYIIEE